MSPFSFFESFGGPFTYPSNLSRPFFLSKTLFFQPSRHGLERVRSRAPWGVQVFPFLRPLFQNPKNILRHTFSISPDLWTSCPRSLAFEEISHVPFSPQLLPACSFICSGDPVPALERTPSPSKEVSESLFFSPEVLSRSLRSIHDRHSQVCPPLPPLFIYDPHPTLSKITLSLFHPSLYEAPLFLRNVKLLFQCSTHFSLPCFYLILCPPPISCLPPPTNPPFRGATPPQILLRMRLPPVLPRPSCSRLFSKDKSFCNDPSFPPPRYSSLQCTSSFRFPPQLRSRP